MATAKRNPRSERYQRELAEEKRQIAILEAEAAPEGGYIPLREFPALVRKARRGHGVP